MLAVVAIVLVGFVASWHKLNCVNKTKNASHSDDDEFEQGHMEQAHQNNVGIITISQKRPRQVWEANAHIVDYGTDIVNECRV